MRHETAIAAGFKKANAATSHMQAYTLATKLLRAAGDRHDAAPAALKEFLAAIEKDAGLMRGCALGFLQFVQRDMKGGDAGHNGSDAHTIGASAPPPDRDGSDLRFPARNPEMKPIHAHRRAQRYMEKRLLRDLWSAWRQTGHETKPIRPASAASHSDQQAVQNATPEPSVPAAATGQDCDAPHMQRAGRSHSIRETEVRAKPLHHTSPKRRAIKSSQPEAETPAAPIQQASTLSQPLEGLPAGSPTVLSSSPKRVTSGSKVSRANGTGGRSRFDTQSRDATR